MLFNTSTLLSAAAMLLATVSAAPAPAEVGILIATTPYAACNCPNNCDYVVGTSCRFFAGPSDTDTVISGTCNYPNGNPSASIECIA